MFFVRVVQKLDYWAYFNWVFVPETFYLHLFKRDVISTGGPFGSDLSVKGQVGPKLEVEPQICLP